MENAAPVFTNISDRKTQISLLGKNEINLLQQEKDELQKNYKAAFAEIDMLTKFLDNAEQKLTNIKSEFQSCLKNTENYTPPLATDRKVEDVKNLTKTSKNLSHDTIRTSKGVVQKKYSIKNHTGAKQKNNLLNLQENSMKIKQRQRSYTKINHNIPESKNEAGKVTKIQPKLKYKSLSQTHDNENRSYLDNKVYNINISPENPSESAKYTTPVMLSPEPSQQLSKQETFIKFDTINQKPLENTAVQHACNSSEYNTSNFMGKGIPKIDFTDKSMQTESIEIEKGNVANIEETEKVQFNEKEISLIAVEDKLENKLLEEMPNLEHETEMSHEPVCPNTDTNSFVSKFNKLSIQQMPKIDIRRSLVLQKAPVMVITSQETAIEQIKNNIQYFEVLSTSAIKECSDELIKEPQILQKHQDVSTDINQTELNEKEVMVQTTDLETKSPEIESHIQEIKKQTEENKKFIKEKMKTLNEEFNLDNEDIPSINTLKAIQSYLEKKYFRMNQEFSRNNKFSRILQSKDSSQEESRSSKEIAWSSDMIGKNTVHKKNIDSVRKNKNNYRKYSSADKTYSKTQKSDCDELQVSTVSNNILMSNSEKPYFETSRLLLEKMKNLSLSRDSSHLDNKLKYIMEENRENQLFSTDEKVVELQLLTESVDIEKKHIEVIDNQDLESKVSHEVNPHETTNVYSSEMLKLSPKSSQLNKSSSHIATCTKSDILDSDNNENSYSDDFEKDFPIESSNPLQDLSVSHKNSQSEKEIHIYKENMEKESEKQIYYNGANGHLQSVLQFDNDILVNSEEINIDKNIHSFETTKLEKKLQSGEYLEKSEDLFENYTPEYEQHKLCEERKQIAEDTNVLEVNITKYKKENSVNSSPKRNRKNEFVAVTNQFSFMPEENEDNKFTIDVECQYELDEEIEQLQGENKNLQEIINESLSQNKQNREESKESSISEFVGVINLENSFAKNSKEIERNSDSEYNSSVEIVKNICNGNLYKPKEDTENTQKKNDALENCTSTEAVNVKEESSSKSSPQKSNDTGNFQFNQPTLSNINGAAENSHSKQEENKYKLVNAKISSNPSGINSIDFLEKYRINTQETRTHDQILNEWSNLETQHIPYVFDASNDYTNKSYCNIYKNFKSGNTANLNSQPSSSSTNTSTLNTTEDNHSPDISLSEGEIKLPCKCSRSIGEIHLCKYASKIKTKVNKNKYKSDKPLDEKLYKQKAHVYHPHINLYNDRWVTYYVPKSGNSHMSQSTDSSLNSLKSSDNEDNSKNN